MTDGQRGSAVGLLMGGLTVAIGSFVTWDICPDTSCGGGGGLMVLVDRSGFDVGFGSATFGFGAALAVIGFDAFRRGGRSPVWALSAALAMAALLVTAIFLARTYVFADLMYGPGEGVYLVVTGAVVALATAVRLRPAQQPLS